MAIKNYRPKAAKVERLTPSEYGSHASMINEKAQAVLDKAGVTDKVVLTDEYGEYVTDRSRLDRGIADPNRYAGMSFKGGATSISRSNFEDRQAKVVALVGNINFGNDGEEG